MMKTAVLEKVDVSLRDEWLQTVQQLQHQVKSWIALEAGWSAEWGENRKIEERTLGTYSIASLDIHTPDGKLILEPVARNYPGRSIVEMYAWPTSYRVRLIQNGDLEWKVLTDSGIYLHQPWDREHFILLARELVAADDMIPTG